ncbi:MAG: hypothetical protein JWO38_5221 [Gemmataceae bacterium]|nr:hypothetical protein [Gemmataceae bacterium]
MKTRRLTTLLLTLAAAVTALAVTYWPTPRRKALARVEALDGTYCEQTDEEDGPHRVNVLMLTLRPVTGPDLAALRDLRPLHRLLLDGSPVTDDGVAYLGELEELEVLNLTGSKVTDAGLVHLQGLKNLKQLSLRRTRVTDAGLVHLRRLTGLKLLNLSETGVTGRGVEQVRRDIPGLVNVLSDN